MTLKKIKIFIVTLMSVILIALFVFPDISLDANSTVTVDLISDSANVAPGDTITVAVAVSHFPNLTRFGPIEIHFDTTSVSYLGMSVGSDMPSTFDINSTASAGVVAVSGLDSTVESIIEQNHLLPEFDEEGEPLPAPEDPSMTSEERVVLLSLRFEVLDSASEDVRFWISNIAGFRNSSGDSVLSTIGDLVSVPIRTSVSSDASLSSLSIQGVEIQPNFIPNVYEYSASVPRSITDLIVSASPSNVAAQVIITGQNGLVFGENEVLITVIAQDRTTFQEYWVRVNRLESYIPEGASISDTEGNIYYFADVPDDLAVPMGFYLSTYRHGSIDVPAYYMEGLREILLYLQGPDGLFKLYVYSRESGSLIAFDSVNAFFRLSQLLTIVPVDRLEIIPEGYILKAFTFRNQEVQGYESEDGRTRILYMMDETGTARFYVADARNNDLYPFVLPKQHTSNSVFIILFVIFLCLALVEAAMIGIIIYQVRKRRPVTPTVRRV